MKLLDLPPELFQTILVRTISGSAVKRALRLKLVCKTFEANLRPALFETRILDEDLWWFGDGTHPWQARNQHGSEKLWHDYLIYRVMGEKNPTVGRFIEMREISQAVSQEMGGAADLQAIVDDICWLALRHGGEDSGDGMARLGPEANLAIRGPTKTRTSKTRQNLGINLLSAAAHFNLLPLAKRLVAEGHRPTSHNYLFAPPIQIAAQTGNLAMLQFFQEQISDSQFEPWSVTGALIRDDMATLQQALRLPLKTGEFEANDIGGNGLSTLRFEPIDHESETGRQILSVRKRANSPEAFDYLTSMLIPWPTAVPDAYDDLRIHCLFGNLSMVRYLLQLGVPVQRPNIYFETPLVMACRGLHHDVVDLLLEHHADPNFSGHSGMPVLPLHESTTAGNLTLARKLLGAGAFPTPRKLGNGKYPALWWAFAQEHMDMVRLLLQWGATFDAPNWRGPNWVGKDLAEMV